MLTLNCLDDKIKTRRVEYEDKKLKRIGSYACFGDSPRDFDIIGKYIISTNEKSNSLTVLNKETMELVDCFESISSPLCVVFDD